MARMARAVAAALVLTAVACGPAAASVTLPDTAIDSGPPHVTNATAATFAFHSTDATATFECRHDDKAYIACVSPRTVPDLPEGDHTFFVRAVDAQGTDLTPATQTWTTDYTPPTVTVSSQPPVLSNSRTATFAFGSSDPSATFLCGLDFAFPAPCSSPLTLTGLLEGGRAMRFLATDPAGNIGPLLGPISWLVDTTPPDTFINPVNPASDAPTVTFTLSSDDPSATFQCKRDGESLHNCGPSVTVGPLNNGPHSFQAQAADLAGTADPTPANVSWTLAPRPATAAFGGAFTATYTKYRKTLLGLCVGAIDNGARATECFGHIAPGSTTRPDQNTLFGIGSITKTFTATLFAVDRAKGSFGHHGFYGAAYRYVPLVDGPRRYSHHVTLLDLVQMYSGLPGDPKPNNVGSVNDLFTDAGNCYATTGCTDGPHTTYSYSNYGYDVLGAILGLHDGFRPKSFDLGANPTREGNVIPPWEQDLDAAVINPLHMSVTKTPIGYLSSNWDYFTEHAASGEIPATHGATWNALTWPGAPFEDASCCLWSSSADMLKWLDYSMRGNGPGALGKASPFLYRTPALFRPARKSDQIGVGWFVSKAHGHTVISKGGKLQGFESSIQFAENEHRGVFVLLNTSPVVGSSTDANSIACTLMRELPPKNPSLPCPAAGE
jgi:CubicO group peptidase (beta-lactamase class C family)